MSITVDEFGRLKEICEPKRDLNLKAPLTEELIGEAMRRLPSHLAYRVELAKNVPRKEWPTLAIPRKDGLGNIKPGGVEQAVGHAFWAFMWKVINVAKEKAVSEPALMRLSEDGTARCPWCGRMLALPNRERLEDASRSQDLGRLKMELTKAMAIAEELKSLLEPACARIEIAGSIRRQKPEVRDIEFLVIPKHGGLVGEVDLLDQKIIDLMLRGVLDYRLNKLGSRVYGPKNKLMMHVPSGIGVDIFSTDDDCWPVALVVRTGSVETNKRIAMAAIRKGWHLRAYGRGFTTPDGELVCRSEMDVFEFAGLPYLEPWERE